MTTPTPHGAPELPVVAYEVGDMVFPDLYSADSHIVGNELSDSDLEPLVRLSDTRAAIKQAAGAVPEGLFKQAMKDSWGMVNPIWQAGQPGSYARGHEQGIIDALRTVQANFDRLAASPSPLGREAACVSQNAESEPQTNLTRTDEPQRESGSSDHLVPCAGGGVTQPLTDERLLVSFLRNTTVFHQSDTPDWLYARDGDGNTANIRASEITTAIRNIIKEHS